MSSRMSAASSPIIFEKRSTCPRMHQTLYKMSAKRIPSMTTTNVVTMKKMYIFANSVIPFILPLPGHSGEYVFGGPPQVPDLPKSATIGLQIAILLEGDVRGFERFSSRKIVYPENTYSPECPPIYFSPKSKCEYFSRRSSVPG